MAMTPEGKIKRRVTALLREMPRVWYNMPVPGGFGAPMLDYIGCANGYAFAIETKAPGGKPTPRQMTTIEEMQKAGTQVFVIDGDAGINLLEDWLHGVHAAQPMEDDSGD